MTTCATCGTELRSGQRFCVRCGSAAAAEPIPSAIRPHPIAGPIPWREPTAGLPLRYGTYRSRYVTSLALLISGGVLIQLGSVYTRELLAAGCVATIAGWVLIPSAGWRRSLALGPAFLGVGALLNGAGSGALLALTLAGWLLVRMRPLRSYVAIAVPFAVAIVLAGFFPQYDSRALVVALMGLTVVASAWLARSLAASRSTSLRKLFQRRHSPHPLK